jgi:nitrogen fixation NifU-like protein
MVQGMTLDEGNRIQPADLIAALDGLPQESLHCADLAVCTLHKAIEELIK